MPVQFSAPPKDNWAVAIVHGIGTPHRGETMCAVCDGIRRVMPDFLPDDTRGERSPDERSPPMQHWTFGDGGRAKVAEVFWGDLSLVRGKISDMLLALCTNLYGAVYVSSRTLQHTSALTRVLPVIPFYLVRWIVLPLHLFALAVCLPMAFWLLLSQPPEGPRSGDYLTSSNQLFLWLVASAVAAGLAATVWLIRRQNDNVRPQPWDFVAAYTVVAGLSATFATHPVASWFKSCVDNYGTIARGVTGLFEDVSRGRFELGRSVCELIISNTPIEEKEVIGIGRYIAINEFTGDVAFYLSAGMILVYILLAVATMLVARRATAQAMFFVATLCILFLFATAMLLEVIDFVTRTVQFWGIEHFHAYWYELGFVLWLFVVAVGVLVAVAWRKRGLPANDRESPNGNGASVRFAYSRLIVSEIFQFTVIGATLLFILSFLASDYIREHHKDLYQFNAPYMLVAPSFFVLLMAIVVFNERLRLGLDIAMDIVNHFIRRKNDFPIRRGISRRFYETIDLLTREGDKPHLLIISHSQGSVITVDALMKDIWNTPFEGSTPLKDRVASMTILTFGSPLTHIYQHYFPGDYGSFSETSLKQLSADDCVKWLNVYREDDPIGTRIDGPSKNFPENIGMPSGGHVRYWEAEVLGAGAICQHLPGAKVPRVP